jgi:hypothetical protein
LITRNLLILHPGVKAQMPHNPASLVRLLYGERAQKRKPRRSAFSQSFQQQFDTATPIGQGRGSRIHRAISADVRPKRE